MLINTNFIIIIGAFLVVLFAIYVLFSITFFQGNSSKNDELQLTTKAALEQIGTLYDKREYALVQLLATKYLERVPGNIDVRMYLAKAYYKDKKYNLAINQCSLILQKKSNDLETHEILARCYKGKGFLNKAIKEFEYVYEKDKKNKDIIKTLAELYKETEQIFMSISAYNALAELLESQDEIANVQSVLAELNIEAHDFPAAFEAYKTRLGIYPKDVETNQKLAELYIRINNYPVAIETLLYMLSFVTEPKMLLWIYDTLADLYEETEDYDSAIEYTGKMLDITGSDKFKVQNRIAALNIKRGNLGEGIQILEELAMMSQNGYDVTVELANAYIAEKDYQKALDKYILLLDKALPREAKKLNVLTCDLYIKWANDKMENGKYDDVVDLLRNASQYNPLNPEIYYCMAINNFKQGNYNRAVESANKALELDKEKVNHTKYLIILADAHNKLGNFFEEKKALSDLLNLDEKNAEGLYRSGLMYASQHDIKNAEECFKKAIQYNPNLISAKYNLALLYENNNRDRAKELYMEVLEQDPNFEEAKNALADFSSSDFF